MSGSGFVTQPPDDLPQASQSTLLLQKLKEMAEVQQQLDRKKEEFRTRMQRCQEKEVDLAARQEDIKEQVRKFDKFLKDNDAKRVRADRKVQEERKAAELKEREKQELMDVLSREDEKRQQLKLEVEAKGKYQRFLDMVCEDPAMSEYFEGIENITLRYETLKAAHDDLSDRVSSGQTENETENARLLNYIKQRTNDLLVFNSDIATKQTDLDRLRFEMQGKEAELSGHFQSSKESTRQLGEVKMAIENIYGRCVKMRRPGQAGEEDPHLAFLDAIMERVVDLQSIVKLARPAPGQPGDPSSPGLDDPAATKGAKGTDAGKSGASIGAASTGESKTLRASMAARDGTHGSQSLSGSAAGASATSVSGGPLSKTIV